VRRRALLVLALVACSRESGPDGTAPWIPDRYDYAAFAEQWPQLHAPNYLPFMVHRTQDPDGDGELAFFCRWESAAMPIAVFVTPLEIPEELQDEFAPRDPAAYAAAVRNAFGVWERELEPLVRFRFPERAEDATLVVRPLGARAPVPEPERQVLGETPLADACRVRGKSGDSRRLDVAFEVRELRLYLADEFGLLPPSQVEMVALHEIGHALGMRGHSPIPADLMFEIARDRMQVSEGLSGQDANSFTSLYELPNGTVFGRVEPHPPKESAPADPGPPRLALAPFVDARRGFELRPPAGWTRVPTTHGMVAVDGTTWDYVASFQIVVHRYDRIEDYLERYAQYYGTRGRMGDFTELKVNGRRALQTELELFEAPRIEQVTLIEVGDGRVVAVVADAPREVFDAYRPWFSAALESLEITELPEEAWPGR
jgi:hypothetical protein